MKRKKIILLGIIVISVVSIALINIQYKKYNGNSLVSRQNILNRSQEKQTILSETRVNGYIICEVVNQYQRYGYALFKPKGKGNYVFQSSMLVDQGNLGTDIIWLDKEMYELFMCDQPGLEYAQVTYTDMSSSKVTTKKLPLLNGKMAIVEAPQITSYSREVAFYDANGNKYE